MKAHGYLQVSSWRPAPGRAVARRFGPLHHGTKILRGRYWGDEAGIGRPLPSPDDGLKACADALPLHRREREGLPRWVLDSPDPVDVPLPEGGDGRLIVAVAGDPSTGDEVTLDAVAWQTSAATSSGQPVEILEVLLRFSHNRDFMNRHAEAFVFDTVTAIERSVADVMGLRDTLPRKGFSERYGLVEGWWNYRHAPSAPAQRHRERWRAAIRENLRSWGEMLDAARASNRPARNDAGQAQGPRWAQRVRDAVERAHTSDLADRLRGVAEQAGKGDWVNRVRDYLEQAAAPADPVRLEQQGRLAEAQDAYCAAAYRTVGAAAGHPAAEAARLMERRGQLEPAQQWYQFAVNVGYQPAAAPLERVRARNAPDSQAEHNGDASDGPAAAAGRHGPNESAPQDNDDAQPNDAPAEDSELLQRYRNAAAGGNIRAITQLANALREAGDFVEAEYWYRQAAGEGDMAAIRGLTSILAGRDDKAEAEEWLGRAAGEGDTEAMLLLAELNVPDDLALAEYWFFQAALAGDSEAMTRLGITLCSREAWDEAEPWLRRAVDEGAERAIVELGWLLMERGRLEEAEQRLRQSAARGDSVALGYLADVLRRRGASEQAAYWDGVASLYLTPPPSGSVESRDRDLKRHAYSSRISAIGGGGITDSPPALLVRGQALQAQNQFDVAELAYAIAVDSRDPIVAPRAACLLGVLREQHRNDKAGAERAYRTAIDIGGDGEAAGEAVERLDRLRRC